MEGEELGRRFESRHWRQKRTEGKGKDEREREKGEDERAEVAEERDGEMEKKCGSTATDTVKVCLRGACVCVGCDRSIAN